MTPGDAQGVLTCRPFRQMGVAGGGGECRRGSLRAEIGQKGSVDIGAQIVKDRLHQLFARANCNLCIPWTLKC